MTQNMSVLYSPHELTEFVLRLFTGVGMEDRHARLLAQSLVDAELHGVSTHGVVRVPGYVDQLRGGDIDPQAEVVLSERSPVVALVDGGGTFGGIAGSYAMDWATEVAGRSGIALVGARNVAHFGAAGYFARMAAARGQIGLAMTNGAPAIATAGGIDPRLGNNPLAIAAPGQDDFCLDVAMSVVSRGRVKLMADAGQTIPDGWAIDADGNPTTDPEAALHGALLPFGGYKGAGLALAVEMLAAALTGGQLTQDVRASGMTATQQDVAASGSVTVGHLFLVIDPSVFRPLHEFEHDTHRIVEFVHASRSAPGESVQIAGQREAGLARQRGETGIPVGAAAHAGLVALASQLGVAVPSF